MDANKKQQFLNHVARTLGRDKVRTEPPKFDILSHGPQNHMMQNMTQDEIVARFKIECDNVGTRYYDATKDNIAEVVMTAIEERQGKDIILPNMEEIDTYGIRQALDKAKEQGINYHVWDASKGREENIKVASTASIGITFPIYGIANTATIIQPSFKDSGRSIGLLPLAHIAIIKRSTIYPRMTQTMEIMHEMYQKDPENFPTNIVHISGPSNTADIELIRVVGVHGPINVTFIILEDM